jgi:homoserine kinase type II
MNNKYTDDGISQIVSSWDLKFLKSRPELEIAGSPERSSFRVVVQDGDSGLWVLEAIPPGTWRHKARISEALALLQGRGLRAVHPYLPGKSGEPLVHASGDQWLLRPYVPGVPLPRPAYVLDRWRGAACARFLADLRETASETKLMEPEGAFSMGRFIREMYGTMQRRDPEVRRRLGPAFRFVEEEFFGREGRLPVVFCHGDFHPLNIVWSEEGIRSVIDWEFLGYKPEVYDMANLIGCVGFEDPAALTQGLVMELIAEMKRARTVSGACWEALPAWVAVIRFAWLSDWLRRRDEEMVELEIAYIDLLIENRNALQRIWNPTR